MGKKKKVYANKISLSGSMNSNTKHMVWVLKRTVSMRRSPKDKDKEALFNVAYNVTDNISSRAILGHNNISNRYLPVFISLAQPLFMRASARELLVPFFTPLVWCGRGIRTHDLPLRKRTLYQLSYRGGQKKKKFTQIKLSTKTHVQING